MHQSVALTKANDLTPEIASIWARLLSVFRSSLSLIADENKIKVVEDNLADDDEQLKKLGKQLVGNSGACSVTFFLIIYSVASMSTLAGRLLKKTLKW